MTAFTARPTNAASQPDPRRLVAGALVGAAGMVAFSIAFGSWVVGSSHLRSATAAEASALLAGTPVLVVAGLVHLLVAAGLVAGRDAIRMVAVGVTTIAEIIAMGRAAILLTGLDPSGGPNAGHPTTQGVALLLIAAAAYGIAALAATAPDRD